MNVKTAKKPQKRIDISYVSRFKMQAYGNDNLYPQNLRAITQSSGTAELCLARYTKFIEGYGFADENFSKLVANHRGETADDVLHNVAADLARFGGFAVHVNYNVLGEITTMAHVPYENCRLEEPDDAGHVAHIIVHPDWTGKATRMGKVLRVSEETIDRICVFDPRPEVVLSQMEMAGGISQYQGQILWYSMTGAGTYPTPIYDAVVTEISTDEGLANVKYRNTRFNFLVNCLMITRKGIPKFNSQTGEEEDNHMISAEDLRAFQGDENTGKILLLELENQEEKPEIMAFPTKNYDKDFSTTDASTIERIYAQFHQELFYSIRMGKLGFSGDVMRDAYEYYAGEVTTEQRAIQRAFSRIMKAWGSGEWADTDFTLQPLKYISTEQPQVNTTTNE